MDTLALWFIGFYQRHLSKHKGFRCAHAGYFGGTSCSHAVKDIVLEQGLMRGLPSIHARFRKRRYAHIQLSSARLALVTGGAALGVLAQVEDEEEKKLNRLCFGLEIGCDSLEACDGLSTCGEAHQFCSCWPSS